MSTLDELIATATTALAELAVHAWDGEPEAALPAAAVGLARLRRLADAALVGAADALESSDAVQTHGWASAKDFLDHVLGAHRGAGGGLLRLGERLRRMPTTQAALAAGSISLEQARVISSHVARLPAAGELREAVEARLLDQAASVDATDLAKAVRGIVTDLDPDGELLGTELALPRAERAVHRERFLALTPDTLGGVRIRGYATVEDVELVKATLMPLTAPEVSEPGACGGRQVEPGMTRDERRSATCPDPTCAHDGRDPRDFGTRLWDALVEVCRRALTAGGLPTSHGAPTRVLVTVGLRDLQDRVDGAGLSLDGGPLSAGTLRRVACDAELVPAVLGTDSQVLDVGRSERLVTPALWMALVLRDRHCAFPGCRRRPEACEAHHIVHWSDGGVTALSNLIMLCRRHHRVTHHTAWTVAIDPVTGRPVWTPPPAVDDSGRFTYLPAA